MAYVGAIVAIGSSLLSSSSDGGDEWKSAASKAGRNHAAVEASKNRALAALPAQGTALQDSATLANIEAEKNEAEAVAQATVQAAAAGASGANVDQTIQTINQSATTVKSNIEKQRKSAALQLAQDEEDILWDANNRKLSVDTTGSPGPSTGQRVGAAALAGVSAYLQAR